ncbi:inter-alpha-trypsin inhibitor heavy chain h5 [Anaeramoeba ignava]|nr:inter-alpha-trypsin inhibitor heavy chain h5 [Anaeramoeba ignava]
MIVFDNETDLIQKSQEWKSINKKKLYQKIDKLKPRGGTDMSLGFREGVALIQDNLKQMKTKKDLFQNRVIFLTDAHPNTGEFSSTGLLGLSKKYSQQDIYITLVGIGVDFNTELCNAITKTKGANYLSVNSASEFRRKMEKEFDFIVTPIAFDLKIKTEGVQILNVYGSP